MATVTTCKHESSLVYFDRQNGNLLYWEVCDDCGTKFNQQIRKSEAERRADEELDEWLRSYRVNLSLQDT